LEEGEIALTGEELEKLSDEELLRQVERIRVYARVAPEHKMRIVDAWKKAGHIVAMTGDGVNDAPALKRANLGVAMGITGTDVAKESADMVLTDDNFASVVAAVEEGRGIYENIRKFVAFLLSANAGEVLIMFIATIAIADPPFLPGVFGTEPLTALDWVETLLISFSAFAFVDVLKVLRRRMRS